MKQGGNPHATYGGTVMLFGSTSSLVETKKIIVEPFCFIHKANQVHP
jgi:hypothetical protein